MVPLNTCVNVKYINQSPIGKKLTLIFKSSDLQNVACSSQTLSLTQHRSQVTVRRQMPIKQLVSTRTALISAKNIVFVPLALEVLGSSSHTLRSILHSMTTLAKTENINSISVSLPLIDSRYSQCYWLAFWD